MSLRQQAMILGIVPSHLSMKISCKRPWNADIKATYEQLVNTYSKQIAPQRRAKKAVT